MQQFNGHICSLNTPTTVTLNGTEGTLRLQDQVISFLFQDDVLTFPQQAPWLSQLAVLEGLFSFDLQKKAIAVKNLHPFLREKLQSEDMVLRQQFYQLPFLWHHNANLEIKPEAWTTTQNVPHPVRPKVLEGQVLYKRVCPRLNKTLSFRVASIEKDLDVFTDWQNQSRVNHFWDLAKPKEELREYLIKGLKDPHQFPVIFEVDNQPVGYFEFYWVKEDRLGPYYDSEAYDRSFHLLVGNSDFLGFKNTDAMLKSASHCLFLDEPRTRKIMAEPRHDNVAILKYIETFVAWIKLKEFDFPHKRSALLECRRERFFLGDYL